MSAEELSMVTGTVLSLFMSYVPGVSGWYEGLSTESKRLVMGVLLLAVAGGAFSLACGGVVDVVECSKVGALGLVQAFIAALIANQATYLITKG